MTNWPGFAALAFKASRGIEDIYELTYIRKDGSRFPAVVSVTALRDAQDAIIGYLLIGTDNTVRKQVEAEQKKLDQRLRDREAGRVFRQPLRGDGAARDVDLAERVHDLDGDPEPLFQLRIEIHDTGGPAGNEELIDLFRGSGRPEEVERFLDFEHHVLADGTQDRARLFERDAVDRVGREDLAGCGGGADCRTALRPCHAGRALRAHAPRYPLPLHPARPPGRAGCGSPRLRLRPRCGAGLEIAGMCLQPLVVSGSDPVTEDVNRLGLAGEAGGQLLGDEAVGTVGQLEATVDCVVIGDGQEDLLGEALDGRCERAPRRPKPN